MDIGFARKCQRAHPRAYWGEPFPIASSTLMSHFFRFLAALGLMLGLFSEAADPIKIVLVAGTVKEVAKPGHHDYTGGCEVMKHLLEQTKGVSVSYIKEGWPQGETVFDDANAIVFYTDGGGKQAYLASPERITVIQKQIDRGVGLVSIHQAVEFPPQLAKQAGEWMGAVYNKVLSGRGHWDSKHETFPEHPVTRGVTPWALNDGWLNRFKFDTGMAGVTPAVWSGKEHLGSPKGGTKDVVSWTFDHADGGHSFNFSGLDAHFAWEFEGARKLMTNGILWAAKADIPESGAPCAADKALVDSLETPRTAPPKKAKK